jgi:DNA-binding NarL/FixJ family response regulator
MPISVLIADDHEVFRTGLKSLLQNTDIKVVAEANDGTEAVKRTVKHSPDVVLMDIRMRGVDGLDALEAIRKKSPKTRVVMLSTYENPTYVARSIAMGADDYMLKSTTKANLVDCIRRVAKGKNQSEESILNRVRQTMDKRREGLDHDFPLTNRETQVLRHVALGLSNRDIGRALEISVETVKEHVQNILRKLQAADRTEAAVWAVKKGLI